MRKQNEQNVFNKLIAHYIVNVYTTEESVYIEKTVLKY